MVQSTWGPEKGCRDIRWPSNMADAGARRWGVGLFPPFKLFMSSILS